MIRAAQKTHRMFLARCAIGTWIAFTRQSRVLRKQEAKVFPILLYLLVYFTVSRLLALIICPNPRRHPSLTSPPTLPLWLPSTLPSHGLPPSLPA